VWRTAAVVGVLAAVIFVEFAFFGDQMTRNLDVLLARDARKETGARQPAAIPVLAPPAAGPIAQLELRPIDVCRPAATCNVLVQLSLRPQPRPVRVSWHLEIFDRCRQTRDRHPGGTATVPPGRDRVIETSSLAMPAGPALAVIPLTTHPVAVAGQPMRLPGDDKPC
jgi:hypothetical protein